MTTPTAEQVNGQRPGPIGPDEIGPEDIDQLNGRIPFGTDVAASVPATWAARMLTKLCVEDRKMFAALLSYAATGEYDPPVTPGRARPRKPATA